MQVNMVQGTRISPHNKSNLDNKNLSSKFNTTISYLN